MNISFLQSTRFWTVVLVAILQSGIVLGIIQGEVATSITHLIELVLGTSVTIRTIDRFAEKAGSTDTR